MPRKPIDYSKTIIYKFVCKDLSVKDLYVGHTTNWIKRKSSHKDACINSKCKSYNFKVYKMIREYRGWENWEMVEIEKYPCNDDKEARARERYWYEELYANMNTFVPILSEQEKKEYKKEWREDNKEHNKEYNKEWYEKNKEYIKEYRKELYEKNKEEYNKKQREYNSRPEVKEKRKEKRKEKITCSCGSEIVKCTKSRHERSKKHKKYIESLN